MNKANTIYRIIRIAVSLLALGLLISAYSSIGDNHTICPTSDEVEKLRIDAENNSNRQGFFSQSAQEKYDIAKSCSQSDEDNKFIANMIGATVMLSVFYGIAMYAITLIKRRVKFDASAKEYKRLEKFALWRFSKVVFWIITIAVALFFMLYKDYYEQYTLATLGVILLVLSYPLYMLFRRVSLYIAYGKVKHKEEKRDD